MKREVREKELKNNERVILKFINISSGAIFQTRCSRSVVLVSVNQYRKRKKQRLAKLEITKKQMLRAISVKHMQPELETMI